MSEIASSPHFKQFLVQLAVQALVVAGVIHFMTRKLRQGVDALLPASKEVDLKKVCSWVWRDQMDHYRMNEESPLIRDRLKTFEAAFESVTAHWKRLNLTIPNKSTAQRVMSLRGMRIYFVPVCEWIWNRHTEGSPYPNLNAALDDFKASTSFPEWSETIQAVFGSPRVRELNVQRLQGTMAILGYEIHS